MGLLRVILEMGREKLRSYFLRDLEYVRIGVGE